MSRHARPGAIKLSAALLVLLVAAGAAAAALLLSQQPLRESATDNGSEETAASASPHIASWRLVAIDSGGPEFEATEATDVVASPSGFVVVGHGFPPESAARPKTALAWRSGDGVVWERLVIDDTGGSRFTAAASGREGIIATSQTDAGPAVWLSSTGSEWHGPTSLPALGAEGLAGTVTAAAVGNTRTVVAGGLALVVGEGRPPAYVLPRGAIWASEDGTAWDLSAFGDPILEAAWIRKVVASSDLFVAVGAEYWVRRDGELLRSSEPIEGVLVQRPVAWRSHGGAHWERADGFDAPEDAVVTALAAGPGGFVALGVDGGEALAWFSSDGLQWDMRVVETLDVTPGPPEDVAAHPSGYVAAGESGILLSRDALAWDSSGTSSLTQLGQPLAVAIGEGRLVVAGVAPSMGNSDRSVVAWVSE